MIIGEGARNEDMDVNPTKEKKLTNVRNTGSEEQARGAEPRVRRPIRLCLSAA